MSIVTTFVGLDYHQDSVQVCILDSHGNVLTNRSVENDELIGIPIRGDGLNWPARGLVWMELRRMSNIWPGLIGIPIRGDGLNWPARGLVWMELRRMSNIWPGFSD
jgi:hypothetical protein